MEEKLQIKIDENLVLTNKCYDLKVRLEDKELQFAELEEKYGNVSKTEKEQAQMLEITRESEKMLQT